MLIEKIEADKVKVTIYPEDMERFNINVKEIKNGSDNLHFFLSEVMRRVSTETNFNPYDGQVVVEATPIDDRLILFVSKAQREKRRMVRSVKAVKKSDLNFYIYKFEKFEDFLNMLGVYPDAVSHGAELYKMGESFVLVEKSAKKDARMSEFSHSERIGEKEALHIREHAPLLAEGEKLMNIVKFAREN